MELSRRIELRTRNKVVMCYPGAGIHFIKNILDIVHGSRDAIINVGGNSIRNKDGTFERSKILLKKCKELLVRSKEIGKKICVTGILPWLIPWQGILPWKMRNGG